jgi:hypothetical protein
MEGYASETKPDCPNKFWSPEWTAIEDAEALGATGWDRMRLVRELHRWFEG